jgi:hypothetical protein
MSCDYSVRTIDEDWADKSKLFDARGNLLDLFGGMRAWISRRFN